MNDESILLFLHLLPFQGEKISGDHWRDFIATLRQELRHNGIEDNNNNPEFIRFYFNRPQTALGAALTAISQAKTASRMPDDLPAPIHLIIDYPDEDQPGPEILEAGAEGAFLLPEQPYITRNLKKRWDRLTLGTNLAEISFEPAGNSLFLLKIADPDAFRARPMFSGRHLPLKGKNAPCFYCSSHSHSPGHCPSRFLDMQHRGITHIGYLPLEEIDRIFTSIFSNPKKTAELLTPGLDQGLIRKEPELQVACAYFDLNLIHQPRFLRNLVFSIDQKWTAAFSTERQNMDCQPFNLGLDCLRSGNYHEAGELFENLLAVQQKSRHFGANVALALHALETGNNKYVLSYLNRAREQSRSEKEQIYIHLLLSRYHYVHDDLWKAEDELSNIKGPGRSHPEVRYDAVRVAIKRGFDSGFPAEIKRLVQGDREIFIRALMDPEMTPVMGIIDEMLAAILADLKRRAFDSVAMSRRELDELAYWIDKDEPEWAQNAQLGKNIDNSFTGGSYFGLLDAESRAGALLLSCQRIREQKSEQLKRTWFKADSVCRSCASFWKSFSYRRLFQKFEGRLRRAKAETKSIGEKIETAIDGFSYRRLRDRMTRLDPLLKQLTLDLEKIRVLGNAIDLCRAFGRNLLICELILMVSALAAIPILARIGDSGAGVIISALTDPAFQYQALTLTGFVVAPMISLLLAIDRIFRTP